MLEIVSLKEVTNSHREILLQHIRNSINNPHFDEASMSVF